MKYLPNIPVTDIAIYPNDSTQVIIPQLLKMEKDKFDVQLVIEQLTRVCKSKDIGFDDFCLVLDEFCVAFKLLNKFLGIAFSDVKDKVEVFKANNIRYPGHDGFFSFISMEMQQNIHRCNGDNNKELKVPKELRKYNSTTRNLLRMMWLLTFLRVTFEEMRKPKEDMGDIMCKAYDAAFGEKHFWFLRKAAKVAIRASSNRKHFVEVILGKYDEQKFNEVNERFLTQLIPIHDALWDFYRQNNLTELQ